MISRHAARILSSPRLPHCDHRPSPYQGPSYQEVLKNREDYMGPLYTHYYKKPLLISEGRGQYLWDHEGRRYLDLISGISTVSVGHCHPRITKVIREQAEKLVHTTSIYMNSYQGDYSKMLCESLGEGFDTVFLTNSGSEANDFAVMLSKLYTGGSKIITLKNSYHGLQGSCKPTNKADLANFQNFSEPSIYRESYRTHNQYIREAEAILKMGSTEKVAGFLTEPVMGVGGMTPLPEGYMKKVFQIVKKHGGLCISDEVQTGFGRLGKEFWGFKWQGARPDIVTIAKAMGNGLPMGAVVTRKEIARSVKKIFNTFGGGPIQCRVGMEVLSILKEEKLAENSDKIGGYLMRRLKEVQKQSRVLGDVRGKGLMIGLEIVKDKESKTPGTEQLASLMERARERSLLLGKGGVQGNILRIQPPLNLTMEDASYAADVLEQILLSNQ